MDRRRFRALMDLFLRGEYRVAQRSAMAVGICAERHPELLRPYLKRMIDRMEEPGVHVAVRRAAIRSLQTADIPPALMGRVADVCIRTIAAHDSAIALRACAMTVAARIAAREPDLGRELRLVIEQQLPYASPGVRARAARVLAGLPGNSPRGV